MDGQRVSNGWVDGHGIVKSKAQCMLTNLPTNTNIPSPAHRHTHALIRHPSTAPTYLECPAVEGRFVQQHRVLHGLLVSKLDVRESLCVMRDA